MKSSFFLEAFLHRVVRGSALAIVFFMACRAGLAVGDEKADWQSKWEKTVEAANEEGRVNVYIGGWIAVLDSGVFQKAFPKIKVVGVPGRRGQIAQRILAERRAGKYLADVSIEGMTTNFLAFYEGAKILDPIKPALILPEVVDESKWWQGRHRYPDPERQYVFMYMGSPTGSPYYNSNLVNPAEIQSYWDLLDPKWKGKIIARDVTRGAGVGSSNMRYFYHSPDLGPKYIRKLFGEMDVTLFNDSRQGTDWLASGKYALCFFCGEVPRAKEQGLPVDKFGPMKEGDGLVAYYGTIVLLNRAPHPNAAKVFINWYLSREGQLTLLKSLSKAGERIPDPLRVDIPKDDVPPDNRRVEGVHYLELDVPGRREMKPIYRLLNEVLGRTKTR